jgi:uncharacterized membrane protein YkvA (DUF1232 family)
MIEKIFDFLSKKYNKQVKDVAVEKFKVYYTNEEYKKDFSFYRKYLSILNKIKVEERKIIILFYDLLVKSVYSKYIIKEKDQKLIIATLFYFITPFDAIYDFIPFVGYLDDTFIINTVFYGLKDVLNGYFSWLSERADKIS